MDVDECAIFVTYYCDYLLQARNAGVSIEYKDEDDTVTALSGWAVNGEKSKLSQILRNLVSNAIKFTPSGGLVIISAEIVDAPSQSPDEPPETTTSRLHLSARDAKIDTIKKWIRISVKDTGCGISKVSFLRSFYSSKKLYFVLSLTV